MSFFNSSLRSLKLAILLSQKIPLRFKCGFALPTHCLRLSCCCVCEESLEHGGRTLCQMCTDCWWIRPNKQQPICSRICTTMFGHNYVVCKSLFLSTKLRLAVGTRAGDRPDDRPDWKRSRDRPRHKWIRRAAGGRRRAQRRFWLKHDIVVVKFGATAQQPVADQAVKWVNEWVSE